ncbi:MAG: cob(I)yrinic acid a,c-diamide adenosyltransferase [Gammaproteobacteria bacterium]|nr:cob(I)yrinic acid a,c-diamide adenosyltransferase [Gammaproteobacteria bacterium]MXW46692.1 cob(I)yrinic acid a,c-diamide adenosyltransferase [Gammaproteobacteria bacterium]MYD00968.1 cob(I)yrinic acid a,c-diamide adenosyltransferase [Gammaproteobacteria bacterium]MYI24522.1 cob(I)yrinic acid a,c-diamide adenosyltransferase [Gammaproteobacteria bacterium]
MTEAQSHVERMRARQADHRKRLASSKTAQRGLVLVYTGDGKGKSSSAFGVIARALGWGQKVGVVQFIKGKWKTGERQFFSKLEDQIDWRTMGEGFTWNTQDLDRDTAVAQAAFDQARSLLQSGDYDLVVLDEINIALRYGYLSEASVIEGLETRSARTSVILTGRDAKPGLCEYADLVSEMRALKHPFEAGIKAVRGIDF